MSYTFQKRIGPTEYSKIKGLKYYVQPNPFEINPSTGGNCTHYAWGRFWEVLANVQTQYKTKSPKYVSTSNACYFYSDGIAAGYSGGLIPKPGAIACWGYNGASHGNPGHVAFVESVNVVNGVIQSIEISQSGWSSGPMKNQTLYPGDGKRGTGAYKLGYYNSYFNGFIYNPVDFGNPAGAVTTASESGKPKEWYTSTYGTGAEVYFELLKYGYDHKACCAVLGNMQQESGIRVYTGGSYDGNGSEGLCQWTFGRKTAMMSYAASHSASGSWKSVDGQVAYLVYELENSEKSSNAILKNSSLSLDEMTVEFEKSFERAGVPVFENRIKYAHEWDVKMSGASLASTSNISSASVNMKQRISKLYSSENYEYVEQENSKQSETQKLISEHQSKLKDYISRVSFDISNIVSAAIPETVFGSGPEEVKKQQLIRTNADFSISNALIQAPFVELEIGGYTIGSYRGNLDDYPNYISKLDVKKINGEINQYTISLVYQIRPGEDPNLLDKLFSRVRYDKISIRYGDCESGSLFKDTKAIITNIVDNRDYSSARITYTIYATSACNYVTSTKFDFKATVDKPSNVIRDLLYNNVETSNLLLEAFPGMKTKSMVDSLGLIPTTDSVLNINAKTNIDAISYINYLVGCMSNVTNNVNDVIRNSSYYITYDDSSDGAYFKISEIKKYVGRTAPTTNLFHIVVGYPDGNDVYGFNVTSNDSWAMLYENNLASDEYIYGIDSYGNGTIEYSPNIVGSSNRLNEIQKNWWTQVTTYPISAQLTMRGLLRPISLMDYIQIDVVFYGQKHLTSGLYVVTGEQDILSGSGFLTNLGLVRVGD